MLAPYRVPTGAAYRILINRNGRLDGHAVRLGRPASIPWTPQTKTASVLHFMIWATKSCSK